MSNRYAIIKNNEVVNVILFDGDVNDLILEDGMIAVCNDWVGIGDWWEESESRFYRAIPNNTDVTESQE